MSAEIIALPGVTVLNSDGDPLEPHGCVIEELTALLELAKAGQLRSFVLVGETESGTPIQSSVLCEADLHVINSVLDLAKDSIKHTLMSNFRKYDAPLSEV